MGFFWPFSFPMFERFTEKARRVIFFARYEAAQFGSPYIETEHLLLGVLREDKALTSRFIGKSSWDIRKEIEANTSVREKTSTSADLPLSDESKRVLNFSAEEADRLNDKHIGTEHLLLGLLREKKCYAAKLLAARNVKLDVVREQLHQTPHELPTSGVIAARATDAPKAAANLLRVESLHPLIGRKEELDRVIHTLGRYRGKNPVLVGEPGVGKRTIVGGLVERIADENVPGFLREREVMELDLPPWKAMGSAWFESFHAALPKAAEKGAILFVDDLHTTLDGVFGLAASHLQEILKRPVVSGQVQCISVATPAEYARSIANHGWLESCFQPIHIGPASEADTSGVLTGIKQVYEDFHRVSYSDDALVAAVTCAKLFLVGGHFPGKAVYLIDEAGSCVKVRQGEMPADVAELQKRIRFIANRHASSIENHGYEKARFYSEEEKKERENLRRAMQNHHIDGDAVFAVTVDDIEAVISRWTGSSVDVIRKARSGHAGQEPSSG
jgi:ATP-dependent Clp protease ATP-binding subunit ClpC